MYYSHCSSFVVYQAVENNKIFWTKSRVFCVRKEENVQLISMSPTLRRTDFWAGSAQEMQYKETESSTEDFLRKAAFFDFIRFFFWQWEYKTINSGTKSQSINNLDCVLIIESIAFLYFFIFISHKENPEYKGNIFLGSDVLKNSVV